MSEGTELGRFLRARRGHVRPEDVGLPAGTGIRRTPGLRREELATLAGVSVDYYTRLERGRESRPSPEVVEALGRALRLRGDALQRLRDLAALAAHNGGAARPVDRAVRPSVLQLLEALRPAPAYVVSRTNDLLAANSPGLRLLPGIEEWPAPRRNITRYMFLHPQGRKLFKDWETRVAHSVAHLRAAAGADPDQPELAALVGELTRKSPVFARVWERYEVQTRGGGVKHYLHPHVGEMTLSYEVMALSRTDGQRLVAHQATPGTPDHDAMLLLDMAHPTPTPALDG
ncbi:helix-turn-helix transcriptional regulator [Streptomyces iconiensis]|uniref:Helix-turn-helix transcriptional regulator n=1 Tax=Streptomyces iconiensis TaxID=1384038 RepID=A0ABT6ZXW5_9ACTN|nr:helix-turn-helix transcriptional regulator [Streptomyces iconiensis]MDJ1133896.1 helix-turn-helix transcriptional regulator [Streptomyces iconiensis]